MSSGACWFQAGFGQDCDDFCSAMGRTYDDATRTYAGSDGTDAGCEAVGNALANLWLFDGPDVCVFGYGCHLRGTRIYRCVTPVTTPSTTYPLDGYRFCACK